MPPYRDLFRPPSSRANSQPRMLYVTPMSPEQEAGTFAGDLANPETQPVTWSPLGWLASTASASADTLKNVGSRIMDTVKADAMDLAGLLHAAFTGDAPSMPGPAFEYYTGLAAQVNKLLPEAVQKKLGTINTSNIAGYITLADGTRIPVPKAQDAQAQGEKALSDTLKAAIGKSNADVAIQRIRAQMQTEKLDYDEDQFARALELKQRAAGQAEKLGDLQIRALELALERETSSPAQRALWGRPATLPPQDAITSRRVQAIGSGLPEGIKTTRRPFEA